MEREKPQKTEILLTPDRIEKRVEALGEKITKDYKDKNLLFMGVLKGSYIFMADLSRRIDLDDMETDFIQISSYDGNTESSRNPKLMKDADISVEGRHVLLVEDIVDTGHSINAIMNMFSQRGPESIRVCSLLSKPDRREVEVPIHYLGFSIEDKWVEGYGLDTDQLYRQLPHIRVRIE